MNLKVLRYSDSGESTLGILLINDIFECYTLEDEERTKKVNGETRIPNGIYNIELRKEGSFHNTYLKKFPTLHKGMLWIKNVPNFEYILIHGGNKDTDTAGCLLVGDDINNNKIAKGFLANSLNAYKRLYTKVIDKIQKAEKITIEFKDIELGK